MQNEWDRSESLPTFKISNPASQKVVVGLTGFSDRMFKDDDCESSKKSESFWFELLDTEGEVFETNDMTSNQGVGEPYSDFSGSPGNSWLIFPNLPAGEGSIAPLHGSTNGVLIIDGSFKGVEVP